jgi:hypothetical protein
MYAGGQPMQLSTRYVPWSFAEGTQIEVCELVMSGDRWLLTYG